MNFLLISLKIISPIETEDIIYDYYYCLYLCFNQYCYENYIYNLSLKMDEKNVILKIYFQTKTKTYPPIPKPRKYLTEKFRNEVLRYNTPKFKQYLNKLHNQLKKLKENQV